MFGIGVTLMVTPLVTALMSSVPVRNSGLASAINNAISRVGPQLAGAVLFIAVTAVFYSGFEQRTGVDTSRPEIRTEYSPLNPPKGAPIPDSLQRASREASTEAFHLAMFVAAGLLLGGAAVNLAIRNAPAPPSAAEASVAAD